MATITVCPYCQDLTEQTTMVQMPIETQLSSGAEIRLAITICHSCNQSIEHEQIIMSSQNNDEKMLFMEYL